MARFRWLPKILIALFLFGFGIAALCFWWTRPVTLYSTQAPDRGITVTVVARRWLPPLPYAPVDLLAIVRDEATRTERTIDVTNEDLIEDARGNFNAAQWSGARCTFPNSTDRHWVDVDQRTAGWR
jgi:hypothetical protein